MQTAVSNQPTLPIFKTTQEDRDTHYIVTMHGVYYSNEQQGENQYSYEIDVPMTGAQLKDPKVSAISLFKHYYAPHMMLQKYPKFAFLATHDIKEVKCSNPVLLRENIKLMNYRRLTKYIKESQLPVKPELYEDAGSIRAAIEEFRKDPDGFMKTQAIAEKRKGPNMQRQEEANQMMAAYEAQLQAATANGARVEPIKVAPRPKTKLVAVTDDEDDELGDV